MWLPLTLRKNYKKRAEYIKLFVSSLKEFLNKEFTAKQEEISSLESRIETIKANVEKYKKGNKAFSEIEALASEAEDVRALLSDGHNISKLLFSAISETKALESAIEDCLKKEYYSIIIKLVPYKKINELSKNFTSYQKIAELTSLIKRINYILNDRSRF